MLIGASVTALVWVLAGGAPALAHNTLSGSDPEHGGTVAEPPERVRLTFRASLDPLNTHLIVTGPDGEPVEAGEPAFDGPSVSLPLPAGPAGEYRVSYQVLSSDGDWVEGAIGFTVSTGLSASPSPPALAPAPAPPTRPPATTPTRPPAADPSVDPAAGEPAGPAGSWWPWLLAGFGLAAAAVGFAAYRRLAGAG
jgi:hypothetical protein